MVLSEYKKFYKKIGSVGCPYFGGEPVFFNMKGFNHLLRKGKTLRPISDQDSRLPLLIYCKRVLTGHYIRVEYRKSKGKKQAQFWGFVSCIDGIEMKLVVKQLGKGSKQFLSIFPLR